MVSFSIYPIDEMETIKANEILKSDRAVRFTAANLKVIGYQQNFFPGINFVDVTIDDLYVDRQSYMNGLTFYEDARIKSSLVVERKVIDKRGSAGGWIKLASPVLAAPSVDEEKVYLQEMAPKRPSIYKMDFLVFRSLYRPTH